MKCKKCGTDVKSNDKFCPRCGSNLRDNSFYEQPSQYTAQNNVSTALRNAFSSTQFFIACICLSVAVFAQVFLMEDSLELGSNDNYSLLAHVAPIICLVILWILFLNAKNGNIVNLSSHLRVLSILSKFQVIITWITVAAVIILWLFMATIQDNPDNLDSVETIITILSISLFAGSFYNIIILLFGLRISALLFLDTDNVYNFIYSLASDDGVIFLIFALLIVCIANIIITRNLHKTSATLLNALSTGYPASEKSGFAKIALFIIGALFLLVVIFMKDDLQSSNLIMFLAYAGFMISMGLSMDRIDYELSNIK